MAKKLKFKKFKKPGKSRKSVNFKTNGQQTKEIINLIILGVEAIFVITVLVTLLSLVI